MSEHRGAPRPRLLAYGFEQAELEIMRPFAGSLAIVADIADVHAEEHDVLLLASAQLQDYRAGFPRRLAFAPRPEPMEDKPTRRIPSSSGGGGGPRPDTRARTQFRPARDFRITDFARQANLESLVRRSCLPDPGMTYTGFTTPVSPTYDTQVLLEEDLDRPLALAALLETDPSQWQPSSVLWLPATARAYLGDWIRFALAHWRQAAPDSFPEAANWTQSDAWAAPSELSARTAIREFEAAEAERQRSVEVARASLQATALRAGEEGTQWRALLTETGDALVEVVLESLESLGFHVVRSDDLPQHRGKKREDLRVLDQGWIALAEVKGYAGAAKSNDLLQLTAAGVAFASEQGRPPDALWYVPNSHRGDDPAQRELPLAGRDDDVNAFGESHHGCIIDTRTLFVLRQRVLAGEMSAESARGFLKDGLGLLDIGASSTR